MIMAAEKKSLLKSIVTNSTFMAFALCVILLIVGNLVSPGFASPLQITNILVVASFLGIVAGAQNLVILGGASGLDLSVGKMVTLGAVLSGVLLKGNDRNLLLALVVVLAVTFFIGLLNGFGVAYFRIPPLVMTLGMSIVVIAVIRFLTKGVAVGGASELLKAIIAKRYFGIPGILYIWLLFTVVMEVVLRSTTFGMKLFSMGANERVAYLSGVRVMVFRVFIYGLSGMICGLSGFLYLGYLSSVYNISLGDKFQLASVIAVVIGGTSLAGGRGNYIGVAIGAFLLQILEGLLTTIHIDQSGRSILFGALMIVIVFLYGRENKL